jgi:hypothetical protein
VTASACPYGFNNMSSAFRTRYDCHPSDVAAV